jgi:hypothetical protein
MDNANKFREKLQKAIEQENIGQIDRWMRSISQSDKKKVKLFNDISTYLDNYAEPRFKEIKNKKILLYHMRKLVDKNIG